MGSFLRWAAGWLRRGWLGLIPGLLPGLAWAEGEKVADLVVVADTRDLTGISLYFANLYNEDLTMFAVWAVALTCLLGVSLGIICDLIMRQVGLDLGKGKVIEH